MSGDTCLRATASGRRWNLLDPKPDDVHWPDIAHALARICRFNGHTPEFYSVAQHCCIVSDHLSAGVRLHGLLHDAHEAFIGDIVSPVRNALGRLDAGAAEALRRLTLAQDIAIYTAAGLTWPPAHSTQHAIEDMDARILAAEFRDIMRDLGPGIDLSKAPETVISPWPAPVAEKAWLERFHSLSAEFHNRPSGKTGS